MSVIKWTNFNVLTFSGYGKMKVANISWAVTFIKMCFWVYPTITKVANKYTLHLN